MASSIYINEVSPAEAVINTSYSPTTIIKRGTTWGFAFIKAIEQLGLDYEAEPSEWRMTVSGSFDDARANLPRLHANIGLISRYAADIHAGMGSSTPAEDKETIGRILGKLTQQTIPNLSPDTTIGRLAGAIAEPFADLTTGDIVEIYYDYVAPWCMTPAEKEIYEGKLQQRLYRPVRFVPGAGPHGRIEQLGVIGA